MSNVIPTDAHTVGDPNHTIDHNNMADVLGLLAAVLAQSGGGPAGVNVQPPAGNATALAALQTQLGWTSHFGIGPGYYPYQFPVQAYGATGNGKMGTGGTGTSGTATFTDAAANWSAVDAGKVIVINQGAGGSATNPFCGSILSVQSATSCTLNANLAANCASAPYVYGTDDTAAINACIAAAAAWAQSTGNYKVQVMFESCIYMLGSLTQQTSPYVLNTQIPVPFSNPNGLTQKLVIDLIGIGDASEPDYWETSVPSLQGTCLVSAVFATSQPNGTYGSQSVIGGPTAATGLTGGFANVLLNLSGITIVCPWNSQQMGADGRYLCQMNTPNDSYLAFAPVNYQGLSVGGPWLASTNIVSNGQSVGFYFPLTSNNDNCNAGLLSVEGAAFGVGFSEHFTAQRLALIYCDRCLYPNGSSTSNHGASILYVSCEASNVCMQSGSAAMAIFIGLLDQEVINTGDVIDSGNYLTGVVNWATFNASVVYPVVTGAANLQIINHRVPRGLWAGAPSAPGSGTSQQNTSYRDGTVWVTSTATMTAVATGNVSGSLTSVTTSVASGTALALRVPSGWYYSVTGGTLTTKWMLE